MQKTIIILAALFIFTAAFSQNNQSKKARNPKVQVRFNNNVELLGFVYYLGYLGPEIKADNTLEIGGKQVPETEWYAYGYHLYKKYQSHQDSKHLTTLHEIAGDIGTDYFINLFIQLNDFPNARLTDDIEEKYFIQFSPDKRVEEARERASILIEHMNMFYKEVDFDSYLSESKVLYEHAQSQISRTLPPNSFVPAMEAFYQQQFDQYILMPSLTIPTGMGFGVRDTRGGKIKIFNVFGPLSQQYFKDTLSPDMGFGEEKRLRELSTHEFGHSFVELPTNTNRKGLIKGSSKLYEPVSNAMASQGYINWDICLEEHFVRAGEVLIARNLGNLEEARQLQEHYIRDRKFIYLPLILEELEKYNRNRKKGHYQLAVEKALKKLDALAQAGTGLGEKVGQD